MKRREFGIGLLTLLLTAPARGQFDGLDELMRLLAARRHGEVDFIEQHFLAILKRPAESSGVMIYDAPNRLEKRTAEPRPEVLLLAGDVLTVQRGNRTHVLDLKAYPAILPFIEGMRATLAGDRAALERLFTVDYTGALAHWRLTLVPRDAEVGKKIARVQIEGVRSDLTRVEIVEKDGDRSLMTLRDRPIS
jgi:hypothetical protein